MGSNPNPNPRPTLVSLPLHPYPYPYPYAYPDPYPYPYPDLYPKQGVLRAAIARGTGSVLELAGEVILNGVRSPAPRVFLLLPLVYPPKALCIRVRI